MHKKLLCTISAVALLSGLLAVGAVPAQAAPPTDTHNFLPDDTAKTAVSSGITLSDKFDGVDQTAHLTNVATAEADRVQWRLCPVGTVAAPNTGTLTQAQFDSCTITIGEDSSGTTPVGDPPADVDEAYEFNWDIPGTEDGGTRDLVAAACTGAGEDVEDDAVPAGDESNCVVDVENNVVLDDAATATPQTSAGEMETFCTADVGGPTPGPSGDACVRGEGGTNAEVDARFSTFSHGSNVSNDGFVLHASTSDDVTLLTAVIDNGDAVTDPDAPVTSTSTCTSIFIGTNFTDWECQFTDANVPDNTELHVTIVEGNGIGFCAGVAPIACELDSHYVVSNDRRPTTAVTAFEPGTTSGDDPEEVDADSSCETPDQSDANRVGNDSDIFGCIFDQFGAGNRIDTTVTFESTGGEGFSSCEGTLHDHDGDGVDEHCHVSASGANLQADASITSTFPGNQSVLFCFDAENGGPADPPIADHGCADETVTSSLSKDWVAGLPDDVNLVYAGTGQPGTDECATGATFAENEVGDQEDLLACVFDAFGNPVDTTDADNGFLEWFIGSGNDDEVDTEFVGTPPSETGTDGHATATIEAVNTGTDNPGVQLRDEAGNFVDSDSVQKNVVPDTGQKADSDISIKHKKGPHRFKGKVTSTDDACEPGRDVVLKKKRSGKDKTVGTDTTNANGKYSIEHNKTNKKKKYYSKVKGSSDCRGAKSRTLNKK